MYQWSRGGILRYRLFLIGWLFAVLLWCTNAGAAIVDSVAAVVNDDVILQSELLELAEPYRQEYAARYSGKELDDRLRAAVRALLERAIETKLLLQDGKRRGIEEIEKSKIDEAMKEIQHRFSSEEEFRKALAERGETAATLREKLGQDFLAKKVAALKRREVNEEVTILEQEVQDYYEQHKEDFVAGMKVRLIRIFVRADRSLPPAERVKKRGMMEEILAEIGNGADFGQLAGRFSEDDSCAPVEVARGELPSDVEQTVFSMTEGQVSDILESEHGFYIVKVLRGASAKVSQVAEVRAKIESILREKRVQERYNDWVKKLRESARISIYFH